MKKVCLLLPQLLQEIIYTTMERNVVLVRHARFLSHVSALFVLKLIMNVTAALLETLFVIRVKRGHFSRACRSRLGSNYSGKLSTFSASATPYLCVATAACPGDLVKASIPVIVGGKVFTALTESGSSQSYIHASICSKLNLTL